MAAPLASCLAPFQTFLVAEAGRSRPRSTILKVSGKSDWRAKMAVQCFPHLAPHQSHRRQWQKDHSLQVFDLMMIEFLRMHEGLPTTVKG